MSEEKGRNRLGGRKGECEVGRKGECEVGGKGESEVGRKVGN